MINQIDLNLLQVFESVAQTKSVKDSAKLLAVTPSAVSQSLSRLELQLKAQLFLREHKKIELSPLGLAFRSEIQESHSGLIAKINDFKARCEDKSPAGVVAVGCPTELGSSYMIEWFSELQKKHPRIRFKLRLGSPRTLISYLEKGEVDFLLADDGPYYDQLKKRFLIKEVFYEELILCASKSFAEKNNLTNKFELISKLAHLDYSTDGSAVGIWYKHFYKKIPRQLDLVMISENVRALIGGIKKNLGVAMVPKYMVVKEIEKGTFVHIAPSNNPLLNPILLVQHQSKIPTRAEKLFLEMIHAKAGLIF